MGPLYPVALRVGPLSDGQPAIEFVFDDGRRVTVDMTIADASRVADRLRECVDGRVCQRPPSQRVLEVSLGFAAEPPSTATAIVPDLDRDLATQGPL